MATKVLYKQGTKKTYLSLLERLPNALYFCTDTKELFRGDDLLSDGVRLVATYSELPSFEHAADGILYVCKDSGCGYVLNDTRDSWVIVVRGVDGKTIGISDDGLLAVKSVPIEFVTGLESRLVAVEKAVVAGAPIATNKVPGIVKPGDEFSVADDGSMAITAIPQSKVSGLEKRLSDLEQAQVGGVHYKGSVPTIDALPKDPACGDLYEVTEDNSEWCWNGEKWFEYGKTTNLSPIATANVNERQFKIEDQTLSIINVDSGLVTHRNRSMRDVIDEISKSLVWEDMSEEYDPAVQSAEAVVSSAKDGDIVGFSAGDVKAFTLDKSMTIKGAASGLPQNFAQEV